jgi:hypothetical protein
MLGALEAHHLVAVHIVRLGRTRDATTPTHRHFVAHKADALLVRRCHAVVERHLELAILGALGLLFDLALLERLLLALLLLVFALVVTTARRLSLQISSWCRNNCSAHVCVNNNSVNNSNNNRKQSQNKKISHTYFI